MAERWLLFHAPLLILALASAPRRRLGGLALCWLVVPLLGFALVLLSPSDSRIPANVPPAALIHWLLPTAPPYELCHGRMRACPCCHATLETWCLADVVLAVSASVAAYSVTQHALLHQPLSFYFTDPFANHSQSFN